MNREDTKLPDNGWTETLVRDSYVTPPTTPHDIIVADYQCVEPSILPLAELDRLEDILEFLNEHQLLGRPVLEFDIISLHARRLHESFLLVSRLRASQFAQAEEEIIERPDLPLSMVRLADPLPPYRPQ